MTVKKAELARVAKKIIVLSNNHSQSAICERLCNEEPAFMKTFWGDDFMESFGDQSPGYFALIWAKGFLKENPWL